MDFSPFFPQPGLAYHVLILTVPGEADPTVAYFPELENATKRAVQFLLRGPVTTSEKAPLLMDRLRYPGTELDFHTYELASVPGSVAWVSCDPLRDFTLSTVRFPPTGRDEASDRIQAAILDPLPGLHLPSATTEDQGRFLRALESEMDPDSLPFTGRELFRAGEASQLGTLVTTMARMKTDYLDEEIAGYAQSLVESYRIGQDGRWPQGSVFISGQISPAGGRLLLAELAQGAANAVAGENLIARFRRRGPVRALLLEPVVTPVEDFAKDPQDLTGPLRLPYLRRDFSGGVQFGENPTEPRLSWLNTRSLPRRNSPSYCQISWTPFQFDALWGVLTFGVCVASEGQAIELCTRLLSLLNFSESLRSTAEQYLRTGEVVPLAARIPAVA